MTDNGWQRRFDAPITLPDGRRLVTLRDPGNHVTSLPTAKQQRKEW